MQKRLNKSPSGLVSSAVVGSVVASLLLTGCGYTRQVRDSVPPDAVPQMLAAQTLNPEAGKNRKVVTGMDGQVAENINKGHAKTFEKTETQKRAVDAFTGVSGLSGN